VCKTLLTKRSFTFIEFYPTLSSTSNINEGLTYEYLIHGIMLTVAGIFCTFIFHPICALAIPIGILMSLSKTGIEIDATGKRIRKYVSWIIFKTGIWHDLSKIVTVELRFNTQHSKVTRPLYMDKGDTTAQTYDLFLISDVGEEFLLNGFTKPGLAFKTLDALDGIAEYEIINHVDVMLKNQILSRRR